MDNWQKLYEAARAVQADRDLSPFIQAGGVAAAILTRKGNIYVGVCMDTASSLGMCAERAAIANMVTCGEQEIDKLVAVMPDGRVGPPCGACRELMMQLGPDSTHIEILMDYPERKTVTLGALVPDWWGGERFAAL
ncbi:MULTISPECIES: cytidine deaminase [unclassified Clostridium]|uniref:cytidine deaminase family protein n=1 Tax=unclassified Clostridium TaxID=2614128 RepID=UPI001106B485|nr:MULTISPECIES: cytidine deaminase [unclassified Clostridium]